MLKYVFIALISLQTTIAHADIFTDYPTFRGQLVSVVKISQELYDEVKRVPELSTRRITSESAELNTKGSFDVYLTFTNPEVPAAPPCTVRAEVDVQKFPTRAQLFVKSLLSVCAVGQYRR